MNTNTQHHQDGAAAGDGHARADGATEPAVPFVYTDCDGDNLSIEVTADPGVLFTISTKGAPRGGVLVEVADLDGVVREAYRRVGRDVIVLDRVSDDGWRRDAERIDISVVPHREKAPVVLLDASRVRFLAGDDPYRLAARLVQAMEEASAEPDQGDVDWLANLIMDHLSVSKPVTTNAVDVARAMLAAGYRRETTATKRAKDAEATLARVRVFAKKLRDYCSPHGVSASYANQLEEVLKGENT